jgi:hypothetical protein
MSRKQQFTAEEVAAAVYEAKGLASIAAKRLGCTAHTVRNYAAKYPTVREAITQAREDLKDFAESKLLQAIDRGEVVPIIFFLKTQAKDRGYVERNEVEHSGSLDVTKLGDDELRAIVEASRSR